MKDATSRPTFCVMDEDWRFHTISPDEYLSYDYSPDGNWLNFWLVDIYGRPYQQSFYVGFPT